MWSTHPYCVKVTQDSMDNQYYGHLILFYLKTLRDSKSFLEDGTKMSCDVHVNVKMITHVLDDIHEN